MYNRVNDEVFEGILTAALHEFMEIDAAALPSDETMREMYPVPKNGVKKYRRIAKRQKHGVPMWTVYFKRAVIAVLVLATVSFGIMLTNDSVRAAIAETVLTWYDKYVKIDFSKSDDKPNNETDAPIPETVTYKDLKIGYIPEGFVESFFMEDNGFCNYMYSAENGDLIDIIIAESGIIEFSADTEKGEFEEIDINGNKGYLNYNEEERTGGITFGNSVYAVQISFTADKEEAIKIAESIVPRETVTYKDLNIGYIPEGFELVDSTEKDSIKNYTYVSDSGQFYYISISQSDFSAILVDIEKHDYEAGTINGNDAYFFYNEEEKSGSVVVGNADYAIMITFTGNMEEAIKIAENIN